MQRRYRSLRSRPWAASAALVGLAVLMFVLMTTTAFAAVTTYTITPTAGAHGTIMPDSPQVIDSGADATFTILPDAGYYVDALTVGNVATTPVSSYTFTDVSQDSSIAASFAPLSPIETFDHNPVLAPWLPNQNGGTVGPTAGTWWVDRYPPAGFAKVSFDGGNRLKLSISAADWNPTNGDLGTSSAHNDWQGRKYDIATSTVVAADMYVGSGSEWTTDTATVRPALWAMGVNANGGVTSYPTMGFRNDIGFWAFDPSTGEYHNIGFPVGFAYGSWHNLRIQLNLDASTTSFYLDDQLVYVSTFASDTTPSPNNMADSVGFSQTFLQAYNYGTSYDVYWDNAVPVPAAMPYTIATSAGSGGSILPPNPTVDWGDNTTLAVTPDIGHHIVDVLKDSVSIGASSSVTFSNVTAAGHTLSATFAPDTFTLSYVAGVHGSIDGSSTQVVDYSTSGMAVTAVPDSGYHFVSWSDGVTTATRTDTGVTVDMTASATFAINTAIPTRVQAYISISGASFTKVNKTYTVKGHVSPNAPGRVYFTWYRASGSKWKLYGRGQANLVGGSFTASIKPNKKGHWRVYTSYGQWNTPSVTYLKAGTRTKNFTVK